MDQNQSAASQQLFKIGSTPDRHLGQPRINNVAVPEPSPSAVVDSPSDECDNLRLRQTNNSNINGFNKVAQADRNAVKSQVSVDRAEISQASQGILSNVSNAAQTRIILKKSPSFFFKSARNQIIAQDTNTGPHRVPANSVEALPPNNNKTSSLSSNMEALNKNLGQTTNLSKQMVGMHAQKHKHYFQLMQKSQSTRNDNQDQYNTQLQKNAQKVTRTNFGQLQSNNLLSSNFAMSDQKRKGIASQNEVMSPIIPQKTGANPQLQNRMNINENNQLSLQQSQMDSLKNTASQRTIPLQKVRIAKKVPQTSKNATNAENSKSQAAFVPMSPIGSLLGLQTSQNNQIEGRQNFGFNSNGQRTINFKKSLNFALQKQVMVPAEEQKRPPSEDVEAVRAKIQDTKVKQHNKSPLSVQSGAPVVKQRVHYGLGSLLTTSASHRNYSSNRDITKPSEPQKEKEKQEGIQGQRACLMTIKEKPQTLPIKSPHQRIDSWPQTKVQSTAHPPLTESKITSPSSKTLQQQSGEKRQIYSRMFNRDSNTYTTNKNFGTETDSGAQRLISESNQDKGKESPKTKDFESEQRSSQAQSRHSKHPSLPQGGFSSKPQPLEAQSINNQTNLVAPKENRDEQGASQKQDGRAEANRGPVDMSEQKENIVSSLHDFEQAKRLVNSSIAQNQPMTKNGMAPKCKIPGLEIQIPTSPQEERDSESQKNVEATSSRKSVTKFNSRNQNVDARNSLFSPNARSQQQLFSSHQLLQTNQAQDQNQQKPSQTNQGQQQHQVQSPLLASMKVLESAVGQCLGVSDSNREKQSRMLLNKVCRSTRNPASKENEFTAFQGPHGDKGSRTQESGVVPPTATQPKSALNRNVSEQQRLPPHPHSTQNARVKKSGSQLNLQRGYHSNTVQRRDSTASRQRASSPLSQYADKPFQPACKILLPSNLVWESSKTSTKRNGVVRGYAANTHQGLVRNYNEDRVSIILNIMQPACKKSPDGKPWPVCSFFGIYDGHGGSQCADFLRDNLHQYVVKEESFPDNPKEAIKVGFAKAEEVWIRDHAVGVVDGEQAIVNRSGSCAIVVVIVEEMCYVANVGDSRAVLSGDEGSRVFPLSRDHKPTDEYEERRVIEGGGKIYSRQMPASTRNQGASGPQADSPVNSQSPAYGPARIFPGRLSVSRSFGDVEAKLEKFGGNPNVLIATPEIKAFKIKNEHDFIVLGCDGIFDRLSNRESVQLMWNAVSDIDKYYPQTNNIHQLTGLGVDYLLKNSLLRRTLDNVTGVMIAFKNLKHAAFDRERRQSREQSRSKVAVPAHKDCENRPNTTKAVPQVKMGPNPSLQFQSSLAQSTRNKRGLDGVIPKSTSNLQSKVNTHTLQGGSANQPAKSVERLAEQTNNRQESTAHTDEISDDKNGKTKESQEQQRHRKNSMSSGNLNDKFNKMFSRQPDESNYRSESMQDNQVRKSPHKSDEKKPPRSRRGTVNSQKTSNMGARRQLVSKDRHPGHQHMTDDNVVTPLEMSNRQSMQPSYNISPNKQTNVVNSAIKENINRQIKKKTMPKIFNFESVDSDDQIENEQAS